MSSILKNIILFFSGTCLTKFRKNELRCDGSDGKAEMSKVQSPGETRKIENYFLSFFSCLRLEIMKSASSICHLAANICDNK